MITLEWNDTVLRATVFGEFELSDYRQFETEITTHEVGAHQVNLLLDLRDMLGVPLGVAWEEIRFSRAHARDFAKVAIVSSDQWTTWTSWLTAAFVDADVRLFDTDDLADAWLNNEID